MVPSGGTTYYVNPVGGNNGNAGTTRGAALADLQTAFGKAGALNVWLEPGTYCYDAGWNSSVILAKTVSIRALDGGRAVLSPHLSTLSWSAEGAAYKATCATQINQVLDASILDSNGDYTKLTYRASLELVQANAGSWYWDDAADLLYVRTADSRAPDADVQAHAKAAARVLAARCQAATAAFTVYMENIDIYGGDNYCFWGYQAAVAAPYAPTVYAKNCTFKYAVQSGCVISGGLAYLEDCTAAANGNDGFNYDKGASTIATIGTIVEVRCTGRNNGGNGASSADNGSTGHNGCKIVRVRGTYYGNLGPQCIDIGTNTQSWNLGCYAHDPVGVAAEADSCYKVGAGSYAGEMWLDRCRFGGATQDLYADTNGKLYVRGMSGYTTAGAGTIGGY